MGYSVELIATLCFILLNICVCFQLGATDKWTVGRLDTKLQQLQNRLHTLTDSQFEKPRRVLGLKNTEHSHEKLIQAASRLLDSNEHLAAGFVRLIFHDCVGGCDGCVDTVNNPDNAGLDDKIVAAKRFRAEHAPFWSQADVNAFLGKFSAEKASGYKLKINFHTGRTDCDGSQLPFNELPKGNALNGVDFLKMEFGVSTTEAIALIGCHSLGHARKNQSGFDGEWDKTDETLDNKYFSFMMKPDWSHEKVNNKKVRSTQWTKFEDNERYVMLHADMILLKRFHLKDSLDTPSCTFKTCPASDTAYIVETFAKDESLFYRVLSQAFEKMIHHGL